jgi:Tfp pilus assembly protein PilO
MKSFGGRKGKLEMNPSTYKWTLHSLGLGGTLAVVALAYFLLIRPADLETRQIHAQVQQRAGYLSTADAIHSHNRELKSRLDETENLLAQVKRRIPESAQEADFLAQLAAAAEHSGVEIVDYRPAASVSQDRHSEVTIQLSAKGSYAAMCRLLHRLESLPRLCHITGMEINAGGNDPRVYTFDLTLQIFFSQKRPAVASNEESKRD